MFSQIMAVLALLLNSPSLAVLFRAALRISATSTQFSPQLVEDATTQDGVFSARIPRCSTMQAQTLYR